MNINELKNKWEFTNIDVVKLINDIVKLLNEYGHNATPYGVAQLLDVYIDNNKKHIEMMMKHPNYNGNLQIVKPVEFNRDIDTSEIYRTCSNFYKKLKLADIICDKTNDDGYTKEDLIRINSETIPELISIKELADMKFKSADLSEFNYNGNTVESSARCETLRGLFDEISYINNDVLTERDVNAIKQYYADAKVSVGMKTSKAVMKIASSTLTASKERKLLVNLIKSSGKDKVDQALADEIAKVVPLVPNNIKGMKTSDVILKINSFYTLDKNPEFLSLFTEYSDAINPVKRDLPYVISLNPIDFFTMSFGNSWASCHTIDKTNKRHTVGSHYSGCYCGGTISYMLDEVSFVTYTIKADGDTKHPEYEDKIYRNMMHYNNGVLVQGRVYPQSKDGATDLYQKLRNLFQFEIASLEGVSNMWKKRGDSYDAYCNDKYFKSEGVHYRDYSQYDNNYRGCNVTTLKEHPLVEESMNSKFTIGHSGICVTSGKEYSVSEHINDRYSNPPENWKRIIGWVDEIPTTESN